MGFLQRWLDRDIEKKEEHIRTLANRGDWAKKMFKEVHEITAVGEKGNEAFKKRSDKKTMMLWFSQIGDNPEELAKAKQYFINSLRSGSVPNEAAGRKFDKYYEQWKNRDFEDDD